ncbi:MAG: hypothetical protein CVV44_11630 [Spirochaetae bacterium HGW-Spirochaetae-1]|jgi:hypothetical protein|nr:MAG: hypothetical protein CVV44_11630 [Spirochaetae bacterium HGW-Spirochaetae-1]
MSIDRIIILFFIAFLVFIALFYRRAILSRLPGLSGEAILGEEDEVAVYETGGPRTMCYNRCRVRLTDSRIIIAQKMLFPRNAFHLRYVISYRVAEARTDLLTVLKKGYYDIEVPASLVSLSEKGAGISVNLPISPSNNRMIEFDIQRSGEFLRIFTPSS